VYATAATKNNDSLHKAMVIDGVSKLGHVSVIFVDPGACYCYLRLSQQLLRATRQVCGEFMFQRNKRKGHASF